MERPRFTAGALRRFHTETGINLLGPFDPKLFVDFDTWEKLLRAANPEKAEEWMGAYTAPELLQFLIADTRGGAATAADTKSPAP